MLTKYILETAEEKLDLSNTCIKNWDEITCAYARKDYNGVVRSFTSEFQFVNEAYDLLLNLYLRDGVKAVAYLSVYTITDRWEWDKRFEVPLDFSTISWDANTLTISCIDNSLSSLIKSKKSTTYELEVGSDIMSDGQLTYDRVQMQNSVVHEIMDNADSNLSSEYVAIAPATNFTRLPVYSIGDAETYENSPITFSDETDDSGSYFLKVVTSTSFKVSFDITFDQRRMPAFSAIKNAEIHFMQFDASNPDYNSNYIDLGTIMSYSEDKWLDLSRTCLGVFSSLEALKAQYPNPPQDVYAIIGTSRKSGDAIAAYYTPVTNGTVEWIQGTMTITGGRSNPTAVCLTRRYIYSFEFENVAAGRMYGLFYKLSLSETSDYRSNYMAIKSSINTSWVSRAKAISIDALAPNTVLSALMSQMCSGKLNVSSHISDFDARLAKTYILAAESIRAIPNAKFYSSFKDFCDWIETVFGYTYYLGERQKSQFVVVREFDNYYSDSSKVEDYVDEECPAANMSEICFYAKGPIFLVYNSNDGKFYSKWPGSEYYNDPTTGLARHDVLFIETLSQHAYYVDSDDIVKAYSGATDNACLDTQDIYFVHRSELFAATEAVSIPDVRDVEYSVDDSLLYSAIKIGYDKQDYDAQCGRDEWNFTNQYTTGIDVSTSTLELISKYRADCYGLEFLAQTRGDDDTDNESDNTVFFVYCEKNNETVSGSDEDDDSVTVDELTIDRSVTIEGALTDTVFNGEFSPHRCLLANAGFICAMSNPLHLTFASSDGNSDIIVDGMAVKSDIDLDEPLFSCGQLSVSTGDTDVPVDPDALYSVVSNSMTYTGFLSEVKIKFAKSQSATYVLIVKSIEL